MAAYGRAETLDVAKSEVQKDNSMAIVSEDPAEKLAALKRKIKDQQAIQQRIEERKKAKDKEMAEAWKAHRDEVKAEQKRLADSIQKACSPREPRSERHPSETEGNADVSAEDVLIETPFTPVPPQYRDKIRVPDPPADLKQWKIHGKEGAPPLKPRLPAEATPGRKKKNANQSSAKSQVGREKSIVQQLPQLFPGLRRTNEGQQILEAGQPAVVPEESLMPKKALLRKAQVKLLNNLSDQVSFYRGHMRRNFNRILEATELEFGDVAGRRQQAAWNLAKPLSITEIKQTKRQMRAAED